MSTCTGRNGYDEAAHARWRTYYGRELLPFGAVRELTLAESRYIAESRDVLEAASSLDDLSQIRSFVGKGINRP